MATPHRRRGVGSALVRAALVAADEAGCDGVFVLGDAAYHGRFGFDAAAYASP